ncbi:MAG: phage major capsid protein [Pirellulaceae bacterium]|nr:phage major capsid protein [Pirellulaceae bacterium]
MLLTPELKQHLIDNNLAEDGGTDLYYSTKTGNAVAEGKLTAEKLAELTMAKTRERAKSIVKEAIGELSLTSPRVANGALTPSPAAVFGGTQIRVKHGSESYLTTKSVAKHTKMADFLPRDEQGRECLTMSELEAAKSGAFLKFMAQRAGVPLVLSEHERSLMHETFEKDNWVGLYDTQWSKNLTGLQCKTLLNDSTSGGTNVNPEFFDQNLITFPLVSGELFPLVNLMEVPRGAAVEGASIANPSVNWGTNEGTQISLFNTDSMLAAINTTIHTITVAIEVGKDFLSDSPADVGRYLMQVVGEKLKAELDNVIANGNGTNRPEGIFTASGVGSVTTGGTWGIDDVESLLFGISKAYRTSRNCAFISNDVSYRRVRALPTGIASDNQRLFGADHESYNVLFRPWKIQTDLANTKAAFGDLGRYRLYRRLGFTMEWHTQGEHLARKNCALLVVRGRFGGRVMDGSAFAVATDCQS